MAAPDFMKTAERVGLFLLCVFVMWVGVTGLITGHFLALTSPYVVAPLGLVAGVTLGRQPLGEARPQDLLNFAAAATGILWLGPTLGGGAPLGYANANAAFAVQVAGLAALVLVSAPPKQRSVPAVVMVAALLVIVTTSSIAGVATGLVLLAFTAWAMAWPSGGARWASSAGMSTVVVAAAGHLWLANLQPWPPLALATLDWARQLMWQDAVTIWTASPLIGAGPGAFQHLSRLGADPDTATAHSALLQVAAETGLIGVALLVAIIACGFAVACQGKGALVAVAAGAWTALGLHSLVDHVLEFPAIVIAAGLVLGWAGGRGSEEFDVAQGQDPRAA